MAAETIKDRIEYLVLRKFPQARLLDMRGHGAVSPDYRQQVESYRAEIVALGTEGLAQRYADEKQAEAQEARAKAEREEQARFFHQPWAKADFEHWSKAAHWTLDEAVALSLGKAPESVRWDTVKGLASVSPFAFQYARRRDLATRAIPWKQMYDPVMPTIFLAWAKRMDFDLPPELEAAVTARGQAIADWQSLYEEMKKSCDELFTRFENHHNEWIKVVEVKNEVIAELKARLAEARDVPSAEPEKALSTRETESLLKLVIGMAVGGYGFDAKAKRSDKVAEIADDLAKQGVQLDVDTVRKWLRQAAELLPGDE